MNIFNYLSGFAVVFSFGISVPKINVPKKNVDRHWVKVGKYINQSLYEQTTKK